ncbi:STAS domain-containing protein [Motilibacter rhizosphaerae]|uniref:STAS domain-containing protein n=1 Tax=Motilibacter rhizosphaerae TaxID=598652 RepID=UPI001E47AF89|nr:STAS domain-containing protein [Motilibacter rhizosphaerae]
MSGIPSEAAPLTTTTSTVAGWPVLSVSGEIDALTAPALRERLLEALREEGSRVVLDLSAVSFLDSTALGVLVAAHKRASTTGGQFRLVVATPLTTRLLKLTGLDQVFAVHPDLESAVR